MTPTEREARAPLARRNTPFSRIAKWFAGSINPRVRWGTFGVGAIFLTLGALLAISNFGTRTDPHLRVYGTFWASGWAVSHHQNPYAAYPGSYRFHDDLYEHETHVSLNLSPPPLLPLFQALAFFDSYSSARVCTFLSLFLFLASMALLMIDYGAAVQRRQILWYFFGPATLETLFAGQDYSIMVMLAVLGWLLFEHNRDIDAGIFLGLLVAIKPNLIVWPIFLALCGHPRIVKSCALTLAIVCTLPVLFYGPHIYSDWLRAISNDPHWRFFTDVSITGYSTRLGHRLAGRIISLLLLVGATAFVAWKRPSAETASGIALSLGLLSSPLAWVGYSLFLAPVLLRKPWDTQLSLEILPLMLPFPLAVMMIHGSRTGAAFTGLFYFLPVCLLLTHFIVVAGNESRQSKQAPPKTLATAN